jgi:hypothetical protein
MLWTRSQRRVTTFLERVFELTDKQAIEASPNPDVSLFDYRAATWEKLENFKAALADGRLMIKAGKADPRVRLQTILNKY